MLRDGLCVLTVHARVSLLFETPYAIKSYEFTCRATGCSPCPALSTRVCVCCDASTVLGRTSHQIPHAHFSVRWDKQSGGLRLPHSYLPSITRSSKSRTSPVSSTAERGAHAGPLGPDQPHPHLHTSCQRGGVHQPAVFTTTSALLPAVPPFERNKNALRSSTCQKAMLSLNFPILFNPLSRGVTSFHRR